MIEAYRETRLRRQAVSSLPVSAKEDSVLLVDEGPRRLARQQMAAVLLLSSVAIVRIIFDSGGDGRVIWLAATLFGLVAGFFWVKSKLVWNSTRILCDEHRMMFVQAGRIDVTLPFRDIDQVTIRSGDERNWLTVTGKDGREHSRPLFALTSTQNLQEIALVRAIGSRLGPDVELQRSVRPPDPLLGFVFDHCYRPPKVSMQPGVTYRYRLPTEMKVSAWERQRETLCLAGCSLPFILNMFLFGPLLLASGILLSVAIAVLPQVVARNRFIQSSGDRFRLVPEGLEVTRGRATWIVQDARGTSIFPRRFKFLHGHVERLERGFNAYYFDPRLIEPDV